MQRNSPRPRPVQGERAASPRGLGHEYSAGNLGLALVPLGFFHRLVHLSQRKLVGNDRVKGQLIAVAHQIVQQRRQ
jgi:hypothetical protein